MPDFRATPRISRRWLIALVVLLGALLLWWLLPGKPAAKKVGNSPWDGPVPVRLTEVGSGDFHIELKTLGTVTALNTVNVRSRVDGELVKVFFEEGQLVKAGDLLAQIDPRPYQVALQQAEGTLAQNQAQLKNAEIDLARYRGLYAEDSIAKQTLDTQQALVGQYRGTVKSNQAAVAEARLNLDFTRIRAPISGRLGLRQVDLGNLVRSSDTTPLVVITQVEPIAVNFTLPEKDLPPVLARVRDNQKLRVEAWDRGEQQRLAEGELHSLDNQIDVATGTVKLKARFANTGEQLFPNQFVNVRLRVETRQQATLIPSAAVQFGARGTFVFVLGEGDKVQIRDIKVAASDGATSLVEEGVKVGERLVLEGIDKLKDGSQVQVIGNEPGALAQPQAQAAQKQGA
ncbi:MdtA/MuxA family multidrug efflux RND transporter periplasmic adaptor subunit [Aquipseudomonas alcaligenes]|uniref:Multidrug efflux pump membrane fusion protein n=1 Tax=Aquipseudomonas alcaligenes (strain ATCC 14909 / DSM 50342 / CCUG 1425 / JCM 20561 / NBRC 14159 / NCIMB 9945 / NCTC 10367 / 1577) TaxID=1215092 RepID=U2ZBG9_AQUA1|nr:MdtA/MuxA family multidrug efflux RND transporter periplasmic adaptor subunit [Pseudomonas alcaligenes]GAD65076.1 putative multidrug efflux pump membrane fusion protein [Pseudomonas alcaligenes NBRC 14159]SUD16315.1 RND family efflux transporter MFP subunit [Pseudomonas alcaligenes]